MLDKNETELNENKQDVTESNKAGSMGGWLQVPFAFINSEKACTFFESVKNRFEQLEGSVLASVDKQKQRTDSLERYFQIVADCQKQTAAFANNQFEKHALHPAIETVDLLSRLIQELYEQSNDLTLTDSQPQCPVFSTLIHSITQVSQIAKQKCLSLDMELIEPNRFDNFDPGKHNIEEALNTNDSQMHKKIFEMLNPGLLYRGTVLRQAKVSVYRFCKEKSAEPENNQS